METAGKVAIGIILGVGAVLGYEHYVAAQPASPGAKPGPQPGPAPQPGPGFPSVPPQLTADGHKTVSAMSLADEAAWSVLDLRKMANPPQLGSWTALTQTFLITNVINLENDPGFVGYASTWGPQMSAQNHRIFVSPNLLSTSPGSRVVALDQAPPNFLEVTA